MPSQNLRIGTPSVYLALLSGDEQTDEDFLKANFNEFSPTTGSVKFEESWSKLRITKVKLKFTIIGNLSDTRIMIGDIVSVYVHMPPDQYGEQETKYSKFARVISIVNKVTSQGLEVTKVKVKFAYDSFRSYDHSCLDEVCCKDLIQDCKGENNKVKVRPNNGPDFFADSAMSFFFKRRAKATDA